MKNIAVMGNIDHGKTTLISATGAVFGTKVINCSENPMEILRTETKVKFVGEEYLFFDYPNDEDYEKNLSGKEDGAVLVVSARDGPMSGTRKAIMLCKKLGIKIAVAFINACDLIMDDDLLEFVEMDVQDMLEEYIHADCRFVRGNAERAILNGGNYMDPIKELVEAVSERV